VVKAHCEHREPGQHEDPTGDRGVDLGRESGQQDTEKDPGSQANKLHDVSELAA
jgi:hypothetical protein